MGAAPKADACKKQDAPPTREKMPSELESLGPPPAKRTAIDKGSGMPVANRATPKQQAQKPIQDKAKQRNKEDDADDKYSYYYTDEEEAIIRSEEKHSSKGTHKDYKNFKHDHGGRRGTSSHRKGRHRSRARHGRHRRAHRTSRSCSRRGHGYRSRSAQPRKRRRSDSKDSRTSDKPPVQRAKLLPRAHLEDPVASYSQSVPDHIKPCLDELRRSKGIQRRIDHFIRRLAKHRRTTAGHEWARLEEAAQEAGCELRTFFKMELDPQAPASSSGPGSKGGGKPSTKEGGQHSSKGKVKGNGGHKGKGEGKEHAKKKDLLQTKQEPGSPRTPVRERPPTEEGIKQETEGDKAPIKEESEEHKKDNWESDGFVPDFDENEEAESPDLAVGCIPAGEDRSPNQGTPLADQHASNQKFPSAALKVAMGCICTLGAPLESEHLFRPVAVGHGRPAPCLDGRRTERGSGGELRILTSIGTIALPKVGPQGTFVLSQIKGWPLGYPDIERLCQVARIVVTHLRHLDLPHIDPCGYAAVGEIAIQTNLPVCDIMAACLCSYHKLYGYRFEVEFEEKTGPVPREQFHVWSFQGFSARVRATRKHSIEILTSSGIVGGAASTQNATPFESKGGGKNKGKHQHKGKAKGKGRGGKHKGK
jgi:hypothetical protein